MFKCCIYQCKDTNFKANHNLPTSFPKPTKCCIYQCKDTNFKANHNLIMMNIYRTFVVFTNAKILILKLITTYQFVNQTERGCIYQCKDTNFKANHNSIIRVEVGP